MLEQKWATSEEPIKVEVGLRRKELAGQVLAFQGPAVGNSQPRYHALVQVGHFGGVG